MSEILIRPLVTEKNDRNPRKARQVRLRGSIER